MTLLFWLQVALCNLISQFPQNCMVAVKTKLASLFRLKHLAIICWLQLDLLVFIFWLSQTNGWFSNANFPLVTYQAPSCFFCRLFFLAFFCPRASAQSIHFAADKLHGFAMNKFFGIHFAVILWCYCYYLSSWITCFLYILRAGFTSFCDCLISFEKIYRNQKVITCNRPLTEELTNILHKKLEQKFNKINCIGVFLYTVCLESSDF